MPSDADEPLDLQRAADELGVHYQTAYRWVRSGKLPAALVEGRYVVTRDDLAAVTEARRTPVARRPPGPRRIDTASARMHEALVGGDESTARQTARTLIDEGLRPTDLLQTVIVPSLVEIGRRWHAGELSIVVEHRASAIVERIIGDISPNPRGRRRGRVVVAAVSGDHHSLPTSMAAVALRSDNWHVEHFGANVPPDELIRYCEDHDVDVVVLSSTNVDTAELAQETALRLRSGGTPVVVGAPGRTLDDLVLEVRGALAPASDVVSDA